MHSPTRFSHVSIRRLMLVLTYRKSMGYHLGIQRWKQRYASFCVLLNRQQNLGASDFCSHSIFPDHKLLIHTEVPHKDLATSSPLWFRCASFPPGSEHMWGVTVCRYAHNSPEQVWMSIHTSRLLVLRKHYMFAEAFIFLYMDLHVSCYRVTVRFCFFNEWMIYFLKAA